MLGLMILSAAAAKAALFMYFNRQLAEGYARQKAAIEHRQKQQAAWLRSTVSQRCNALLMGSDQAGCNCPQCSGR